MAFFRLKHSFTAGELSPLMNDRVDFERYRNGCSVLQNMVCATQGPAVRRSGFKFIYDLNTLGLDPKNPQVRMIPFIFNEIQAYSMIFYRHTSGRTYLVFGTTNASGEDGLVVGDGIARQITVKDEQEYIGNGDYEVSYPPGSTELVFEAIYTKASDGTTTDITSNSTRSYDDITGICTITIAAAPVAAAGDTVDFTIDMQAPTISIGEVVTLILPAGWDIANFDYAQSGDEMYIAQAGMQPHIIRRWNDTLWEVVKVTFTDQPKDWSDTSGWPERVTFHQQRLVFAANLLRRQTVWTTQAGDFSSFSISSPLLDSDAVTFTLDSGTQNKIQWIVSGKSLHVGTLGNEWTVAGNDRSALTPSNILAQRQTNSGSETNKPLLVGLTTLFIERHGRVINEFVYDYTFDSYKTSDMSILAPHLTKDYSIIDWSYQQTPDSIIWCVRADGTLLGITYQRQHQVVGWHRHHTEGEFKTLSVIPGTTREDDVWVITARKIEGVDRYYVEKLEDVFNSDDARDGRFLDSHLVYDGVATNSIGGLIHLRGLTVSVLADGTAHPPVIVSLTGSIKLNNKYSKVVVGLPYTSEVRPHLTDVASDQAGSSRGRTQRITSIAIDLYKSLGMWVGRYTSDRGDVEEEQAFRVPTNLMGQAVPLFTGWYQMSFPEGLTDESNYFIRQKQPFPLIVRGVVDEVEVYG